MVADDLRRCACAASESVEVDVVGARADARDDRREDAPVLRERPLARPAARDGDLLAGGADSPGGGIAR